MKFGQRCKLVLLVFFSICVFSTGCKRDVLPAIALCNTDYIKYSTRNCLDVEYLSDGKNLAWPVANPNNPNEFACLIGNRLVRHNLENGETTLLVEGLDRMISPDWGSRGWLTFSAQWRIWVVREDGSDLRQVSFNKRDLYPKFYPDGEHIVYTRNGEHSGNDYYLNPSLLFQCVMMVIDVEGNEVDSLCPDNGKYTFGWDASCWGFDPTILYYAGIENADRSSDIRIGVKVFDTKTYLSLPYVFEIDAQKHVSIYELSIHPKDGRIYYRTEKGIYCFDPESGKIDQFRVSCPSEFYDGFTITEDAKYIIAVRVEAEIDKSQCQITYKRKLVRMKIDGSDEEVIEVEL